MQTARATNSPPGAQKELMKRYTVPSIVLCRKTVWFALETNSTVQKSWNCTPGGWQNVQWIKRQAYQLLTQISWSATLAKRRTATGDHSILIVCHNYAQRSGPSRSDTLLHPQTTLGEYPSIFRTTIRTLLLLRKQLCFYKDSLHISATKSTVRRSCYKGSQN